MRREVPDSLVRFYVLALTIACAGAVAAQSSREPASGVSTLEEMRDQLVASSPLRRIEPSPGVTVKLKGSTSYPTSFDEWTYRAEGAITPADLVSYYASRVAGGACALPAPTVEGAVAVTFGVCGEGSGARHFLLIASRAGEPVGAVNLSVRITEIVAGERLAGGTAP